MSGESAKLNKEELREDEFVEWVMQAVDYIRERYQLFVGGLVVVVGLILGVQYIIEAQEGTRVKAAAKLGDMLIADREAILSSVIYGPDRRTQITPATSQVLFTTYAPPGIEQESVCRHLEGIRDNVLLVSPDAELVLLQVYGTD